MKTKFVKIEDLDDALEKIKEGVVQILPYTYELLEREFGTILRVIEYTIVYKEETDPQFDFKKGW